MYPAKSNIYTLLLTRPRSHNVLVTWDEDLQLAGKRMVLICSSGVGGTNGNDLPACMYMYNMCGFTHDCGCVVNDSSSMAVWEKTIFYLA